MPTTECVRIEGAGGTEALTLGQLDLASPGPGEVLVEVAAAGLNRADILQRRGFYPAPKGTVPDVPGLEYAGTVAEIGAGVTSLAVGDRVMGIVAGGAMARHIAVHERTVVPVPAAMALTDAAAIPEVFMTAFDALFLQGGMGMGKTALVHAIGSGVGTAALQLVTCAGGRCLGTSRTETKLARCAEWGLEAGDGIVVSDGTFADAVRDQTAGAGPDVILDTVGAAYLGDNLACIAAGGTIVVIGLMGGIRGDLALAQLLAKRIKLVGSVLRARSLEEKAALAQAFRRSVSPLFDRGRLQPVVEDVMPMREIAAAHERLESNETVGKIVLAWS